MIFGIGTDIVEVKRIRNLDSLEKFADKILSLNELDVFKSQIDEKNVAQSLTQGIALFTLKRT